MCPPYELLDNENFGTHQQALEWLMDHYQGPLSIATGYLDLQGLSALARLAAQRQEPTRLLLGAVPEALSGSTREDRCRPL